jgi:hypothetical protein
MGKLVIRYVVLLLIGALLVFAAWAWLALHWSYSEGERTGYVQKFSHKGWLCKTWEGEVAMVTMPGAIPDKFEFTVSDDAVAAKINALAGHRIVVHYRQHKFVPTACFGETEYFVSEVRDVEEPKALGVPLTTPGR